MIIAPPPVPPRGTAAFERYRAEQARLRRVGPALEIGIVLFGLILGCAGAAAILIRGGYL